LVERFSCPTDARGSMASITALGVSRLRAASKTHLDGVRRYFLDVVSAEEEAVLQRSLERVAGGLTGATVADAGACAVVSEA